MLKVAINGFGRIGRQAFKISLDKYADQVQIVGINDLADTKTLAHLLKYDTSYGRYHREVSNDQSNLIIDGVKYPVYTEKEPNKLPWQVLGVDIVIESTGHFTDEAGARLHLQAGAKRVVISSPAKDDSVKTFLMGVNEDKYAGEQVINNASCTTNCISPVAAIIHAKFGIAKAMMTTIHAYTQDQELLDGPHKDLRRSRAAAENIVPTSTGAAISTTQVIPELKNLFDGIALRVPVALGSISDFTFLLKQPATREDINQAFKDSSQNPRYKGILAVTEEPIVSSDIIGRSESAIVDLSLTKVVDSDLVKVFAWYDNEYGYANRLVEQAINVGKSLV